MFSRETQFQWAKGYPRKNKVEARLYVRTHIECVIPSAAVLQAERGTSLKSTLCSSVTDSINPATLNKNDAPSQTILRLHHDQRTKVGDPIRRYHGQPLAPRLAAQEQTHTRIHQPLQPDPPRLLRTLLLSRCRDRPGKRNQRLATQQEDQAYRSNESEMGRSSERLGQRIQARTRSSRARGDPSPRWRKRRSSG